VAIRAVQAARAGRHDIHCAPQAATDLPALVPSHHRAAVHVVLVHGVHGVRAVVHRHELLGALDDVHVLRGARHGLPAAQVRVHVHHGQPVDANVGRLLHQLHHVRVPEGRRAALVPRVQAQHHSVVHHVPELPDTIRPVLLQRVYTQVPRRRRVQEVVQTTLIATKTTTAKAADVNTPARTTPPPLLSMCAVAMQARADY